MNLAECQDWVAAHCHRDYYAAAYRSMENDYLPHLCNLLEGIKPGKSLEVGPGWGTMSVWLAFRDWDVKMIDLVPFGNYITAQFMMAMEREVGREIGFRQHDVCGEPIDMTFDLVVMTQVLPHLKWKPFQAVKNLAAMTAPDGLCVVTALDRAAYSDTIPPYEHWYQVPEKGCGEPSRESVVTMYDQQDLEQLMTIGFDETHVYRPTGSTCLFAECRRPRR